MGQARDLLNKRIILHDVVTSFCNAVPESYSCEVEDLHSADKTETNEQAQQTSSTGCKADSK
jgi:hypothetical protein